MVRRLRPDVVGRVDPVLVDGDDAGARDDVLHEGRARPLDLGDDDVVVGLST
jgi:hypothetical protein